MVEQIFHDRLPYNFRVDQGNSWYCFWRLGILSELRHPVRYRSLALPQRWPAIPYGFFRWDFTFTTTARFSTSANPTRLTKKNSVLSKKMLTSRSVDPHPGQQETVRIEAIETHLFLCGDALSLFILIPQGFSHKFLCFSVHQTHKRKSPARCQEPVSHFLW